MTYSPVPNLSVVTSPAQHSLSYRDLEIAEEPIGVGGQAVVYEATVTESGAPSKVALKEPKHEQTITTEAVESFFQEANTWQTIDQREREKPRWSEYEHIVGIVDTGEKPFPWIAMEYMDGGDLENRLDDAPDGLPVDESLWIGECLCRGLEIADELGYSHLDVKPRNILFRQTPEGIWDVPKLADWGVARTLAEQTGTMEAQTIPYSAPEQFEPSEFGDPDSLTDLYQVGAVVYTMLTGEPPYTGSNRQIMRKVLGDGPTPPSHHRSELSELIDVTVTMAMAKNKSDRFRGLHVFEQALQAVRTNSPLPHVVANQIQSSSTKDPPSSNKSKKSTGDSARNDAWVQFQGNATQTGYHPEASAPVTPVTDKWRFETGGVVRSSPAVAGGTVYVGSSDNTVYALDAATGDKQWAFETGDSAISSPAVADGTVYIGNHDNTVYALDAATGDKQWAFRTGDWVKPSPAVAGGTVYVGSYDNMVYAIDAATGDKQWDFETGGPVTSSPAVADGTVFVGNANSTVYALDAATGDKQWDFETGDWIWSSPAVADGTVYIGSDDKTVYALE
jgi:outer membrane protein assembly factor BamB